VPGTAGTAGCAPSPLSTGHSSWSPRTADRGGNGWIAATRSSSEQGATAYLDADLRDTAKILAPAAAVVFDRVHSIQRAVEVGSVDAIISAADLRPAIIEAIERGLAQ
jgi:hypothetical protein